MLFYQDFKDTFVCNTQHVTTTLQRYKVVLSGFQRYFCMQYTTFTLQVYKDQVVLSGFQRYFCMQYTT